MNIDLSSLPYNQIVWGVVGILVVIIAVVILRFFWKHIIKYLFQGCLVLVGILALLALLHYLKVF
jgi:hypothetical protein